MGTLTYKDYEGTAEYDADREVFRGKVLFVNDLVTYEATDSKTLKEEFIAAIEDYIQTCKALGREPQKPYSGQFNVRVPPELHRRAASRAARECATLNDIVNRALDAFLNGSRNVQNNVNVTVSVLESELIKAKATATTPLIWNERRALQSH